MYVAACLFALIVQSEFLTSDNLIGVRRQVITDTIDAVYEFTGVQDIKRIENAYTTIDQDADSVYNGIEQALYNKSFENEHLNEMFGRSRGILNQVINYVVEDTIFSNLYSSFHILSFVHLTKKYAQMKITYSLFQLLDNNV